MQGQIKEGRVSRAVASQEDETGSAVQSGSGKAVHGAEKSVSAQAGGLN